MNIEKRLAELHITLPEPSVAGHYRPAVKTGRLVYISGQLHKAEGRLTHRGRVGKDVSLDAARKAARTCVINALATLKEAVGSLDKVQKIVKITGYVTSAVGFHDQHKVMDGATELLAEIFGPAGLPARSVSGVVELPMGAVVELDMIAEVK